MYECNYPIRKKCPESFVEKPNCGSVLINNYAISQVKIIYVEITFLQDLWSQRWSREAEINPRAFLFDKRKISPMSSKKRSFFVCLSRVENIFAPAMNNGKFMRVQQ